MKLHLETIQPDSGSSFRILLTPKLNEIFYWHFHPEIEIVYVEAEQGIRHIGDHISTYSESDLALIGSFIPHLNFDYGVKTTVETVVIQLQQDFFSERFVHLPEFNDILVLFERVKTGIAFYGDTKKEIGRRLKKISLLGKFDQLLELLSIFQFLSQSQEFISLHARPISSQAIIKQQARMLTLYQHVEEHFKEKIDTQQIANKIHLSVPAFCRYFKQTTKVTYTDFVNQFRIRHAQKLLLQHHNVTEACFDSGFENLSYFTRTFTRITGQRPSEFRKNRGIVGLR